METAGQGLQIDGSTQTFVDFLYRGIEKAELARNALKESDGIGAKSHAKGGREWLSLTMRNEYDGISNGPATELTSKIRRLDQCLKAVLEQPTKYLPRNLSHYIRLCRTQLDNFEKFYNKN